MSRSEARPPNLVARLFWTGVLAGPLALAYGPPGLAATGAAFGLVLLRHVDRPRRFRARIRRVARAHARTLALRRRQECFVDAYGNEIRDGWLRECDYFLDRTVLPQLAQAFPDYVESRRAEALAVVEAVAETVALPDEAEALPEDGIGYERFCLARLRAAGWRVHPTPASGDQGADIVASRGGSRLVLQCKRYGKPVGNAAVQEAAAARNYWEADAAAVVSNAGFTPAARKLAAATAVLLLHHDDLDDLHEQDLPAEA
ncbi:restriction endonuclease [Methylobacterium symbioticum]|uniref:Restriction endonuclease type IV Mrr domain-containing protein n=1 Tax=Methylobacterium symbioticum TaxID=2584084 RepID=A0A509EM21_9HYPH|nr:restriction endonuclease [Methylobacterium symbioticum]VUD74744.1 hypothetical protein MET9862_05377 [Methylobacterium symbioticum]